MYQSPCWRLSLIARNCHRTEDREHAYANGSAASRSPKTQTSTAGDRDGSPAARSAPLQSRHERQPFHLRDEIGADGTRGLAVHPGIGVTATVICISRWPNLPESSRAAAMTPKSGLGTAIG